METQNKQETPTGPEASSGSAPIDEEARRRFEEAWRRGQPESIEQCLPSAESPLYLATLEELLQIQLEFVWKASRHSPASAEQMPTHAGLVDEYIKRFALHQHPALVLRLVRQEYYVRHKFGDKPSPTEYHRRFPELISNGSTPNDPIVGWDDDEGIGEVAGYRILSEIGRGGMGVVYRARDLAFDRDVALKVLQHRYKTDASVAQRFFEEARITGQLQHPGIPAVHQVGTLHDGRPFLAMKLIEGKTLYQILNGERAEGRLPNWLAVFESICQAVGYAHSHHVIHRDLKPGNIMVGSFGEVQVMDWGLAKLLTSSHEASPKLIRHIRTRDDAVTQYGSVLGTPGYMSPEQAAGEIERIDTRSDVFSLGAILGVLLTGRPPDFGRGAEPPQLVRKKLTETFVRLDSSAAEPELIALAKRCLSLSPIDRPANALTVATQVAGFRAAANERARVAEMERAKAEVQVHEQRKRRKVQLALVGSAVLLLALTGISLWWMDRQAARRDLERRIDEADKARIQAEHLAEQSVESARNRQAIDTALTQAETALGREITNYGAIDAALSQAEHRLVREESEDVRARFDRLKQDRAKIGCDRQATLGDRRRSKVLRQRSCARSVSACFSRLRC